jgi:hypothetical protein
MRCGPRFRLYRKGPEPAGGSRRLRPGRRSARCRAVVIREVFLYRKYELRLVGGET